MSIESDRSWAGGCLDHETLAAYSTGRMSAALVERIAGHLGRCSRCTVALESVHSETDILLRNLQRYLPGTPSPAELNWDGIPGLASAAISSRDHASAAMGPLPRPFGQFELLEKLGQGGMAIVFKARQLRPHRLVALKIPLYAALYGSDTFERFRIETEAVARLEHENIVRIYECGEQEGLPYFSMEYMDGVASPRRCRESRCPRGKLPSSCSP
jgi:serine/threonine protein kinase